MNFTNIPFRRISACDIPRPSLPITIVNPESKKSLNTYGIIDTGADECAFPAEIAELLDINLRQGKSKTVITGNGETKAYSCPVSLDIKGFKIHNIFIDFLPNLHLPLLGTKSFLSKFILIINYPRKTFSLKLSDHE